MVQMSIDNRNKRLIEEAISNLQATAMDGWRSDLRRATIKMLELAKQDSVNPPGHNPRSVEHLHEIVTPEWLWERS
jgi:hypothetical protein